MAVTLPVSTPIAPMLAKAAATIPDGDGWWYEPKFDGFRCIVVRDGDSLELTSRNERPFTRYFPELLAPLAAQLPQRCVLDGEIVIADRDGAGLDFDALLQRIHPAESRIARLAQETPAAFVAFDVLAVDDASLLPLPLSDRLRVLDDLLVDATPPLHRSPATTDVAVARTWFERFEGAGLDGVVAKRLGDPYTPDKRTMVKVKHERTAECVVAGFRMHKDREGVGSLLLGLHDEAGDLHHVGVVASFTAAFRRQLLTELAPLMEDALEGHPWRGWAEMAQEGGTRMPGAQSRWNAGKDLSWLPLRVERVVEVTFGQLQNGRFRHGVRFVRWRPDREPRSCTYDQLDVAVPMSFEELMAQRG